MDRERGHHRRPRDDRAWRQTSVLNRVLNVVANQLQPLVGELLSVAESNEPPHPAPARLAVLEGLTELYGQLEQFDVREMVDNEQAII